MKETVKIVNGYSITRIVGTRRFYTVEIRKGVHVNFHTIKAAAEYIEQRL